MELRVERIIIERAKKQARQQLRDAAATATAEVAPLLEEIAARVFDAGFDVTALKRARRPSRAAMDRLGEELGQTPWAFITEQRMRTALFVFENHPEIDVSDVALEVGWKPETVQNFGPAFYRWHGRWPTEVQEAAGRAAALAEAARRRELWFRYAVGKEPAAAEREELLASLCDQEGLGLPRFHGQFIALGFLPDQESS